jgi:hypothetical protein
VQVPDAPLTLTKAEVATRQVEGAIEALVRGHFDVAITLAGAAEGMIKGETPTSLFAYHRDHPKREEGGITEKELVSHLNKERDWLKHACEPDSMQFQLYTAAFMVARAATKLGAERWTPPIAAFWPWWTEYVETVN